MKIATKVVYFLIEHRRPIGMILGGILTLLGVEDVVSGQVA